MSFQEKYEIDDNVWLCNIINNNTVEVYLENLKIFKRISIYHPKFNYMIDDTMREIDEDSNIISIKITIGSNIFTFGINNKYCIKIYRKDDPLPNKMLLPFYLIDMNKIKN